MIELAEGAVGNGAHIIGKLNMNSSLKLLKRLGWFFLLVGFCFVCFCFFFCGLVLGFGFDLEGFFLLGNSSNDQNLIMSR